MAPPTSVLSSGPVYFRTLLPKNTEALSSASKLSPASF